MKRSLTGLKPMMTMNDKAKGGNRYHGHASDRSTFPLTHPLTFPLNPEEHPMQSELRHVTEQQILDIAEKLDSRTTPGDTSWLDGLNTEAEDEVITVMWMSHSPHNEYQGLGWHRDMYAAAKRQIDVQVSGDNLRRGLELVKAEQKKHQRLEEEFGDLDQ